MQDAGRSLELEEINPPEVILPGRSYGNPTQAQCRREGILVSRSQFQGMYQGAAEIHQELIVIAVRRIESDVGVPVGIDAAFYGTVAVES